jgi:hypothetical protein
MLYVPGVVKSDEDESDETSELKILPAVSVIDPLESSSSSSTLFEFPLNNPVIPLTTRDNNPGEDEDSN